MCNLTKTVILIKHLRFEYAQVRSQSLHKNIAAKTLE